jgi:glutathione S-transferase
MLNGHLKGRRHVADGRLTIADFALGASLNMTGPAKIPVGGYPEINRWYADLGALPAWRKSFVLPQAA